MKHIPNILTISRFVLIPFICIAIINDDYMTAFVFLTISGITDILDGFIARKFGFITNFGKLIDPLADKSTQLAVLITLSLVGIIPYWILIIVFIKELTMISGASFLYGNNLIVSSRWYGKLATVVFYIAIVCSLTIKYFNWSSNLDLIIYYIALILSIFALIMYFIEFFKNGYINKQNLKSQNKSVINNKSERL